jgi:hypothetical protein
MSNAANKQESCSQRFISTNMNLLKEAAMSVMPKIQPVKVMMKLSGETFGHQQQRGREHKDKGYQSFGQP